MQKYLKHISFIILVVLLGVIFYACLPLLHSGFFPIHDDEQIGRLVELHKILFQGQFPPRWVPDLGFGYGFPLFNFYPPLFYYVGEFWKLFGFTFVDSTKLTLVVGFLLSATSMYLWVSNRWGIMAGIFSSVLYSYVPYHAVDIYVRGAFSEFFSFIFIPAVFWTMDKITTSEKKYWTVLFSLMLSFVVLAHNLVALQALPFIALYTGFLFFEQKKNWKKILISFSVGGLLALGVTAYFWLPALAEKKFTLVDSILTKELANYAIHFVCPQQLWNSPWGYGGSVAGCVDGLSFQLGKLDIFIVLLALIGLSIKKQKSKAFAGFLFILFLFSIFLTTNYSQFIWNAFSPFWYIQFPWRFLLFAGIFSSALGGFFFSIIEQYMSKKIAIIALLVMSGIFVYQVRNDFKPQSYLYLYDNHYASMSDLTWRVSSMSYEYVPKQTATQESALHTTELAIDKKDIPSQSFSVVSGKMNVSQKENISYRKTYIVSTSQNGILQVNTFSFPGWKVIVDGRQVRYNDTNRLHLIQIPLSAGMHIVEVIFANTPVRTAANTVSLVSIILLIGYFLFNKNKNYEKKR